MSLEQTIADNTAAIRELIAAIKAGVPTTEAQVAAVAAEAAPLSPQPSRASAKADQAQVSNNSASSTPSAPSPAEAAAPPKTAPAADSPMATGAASVTYVQIAAAAQELMKTRGRDAFVAILQQYDAAKATDVKPERWPDFLLAIQTATTKVEA